MTETCPLDILKGATGDQLAREAISDVGTSGRVKRILAWARTGLDRLYPARPIAVNLPTDAKYWTWAAKRRGQWSKRIEEAAEQNAKRLFVTDKDQVAKRRAVHGKLPRNLRLW